MHRVKDFIRQNKLLFQFLILFIALNFYLNAESILKGEYYSSFFDAFDLNSIVSLEKGHNVIRFSCINSMSASYIIQVNWTKQTRNMELIVENSPNRHKSIKISKKEINEILQLLSECDFYNQDSQKIVPGVRDGAVYILEINIDGKYKIVSRWWPPHEEFMFKIHEFLVKKAGGQAAINAQGKMVWNQIEWIEE